MEITLEVEMKQGIPSFSGTLVSGIWSKQEKENMSRRFCQAEEAGWKGSISLKDEASARNNVSHSTSLMSLNWSLLCWQVGALWWSNSNNFMRVWDVLGVEEVVFFYVLDAFFFVLFNAHVGLWGDWGHLRKRPAGGEQRDQTQPKHSPPNPKPHKHIFPRKAYP